jgi:pilus assembly protein Flp/PilA
MINSVCNLIIRLRNDERGLTAVEYAVLGGLLVIGITAAAGLLTTDLKTAFGNLLP